jgi:hypothetical protein
MYFATHFHNWYHDAPVREVCRYIEELALWGCNLLMVWFDMHHYTGIDDPAAQAMIARLRAMLETAESVGMQSGLAMLANEAYANSPLAQRGDFRWKENGYKSDIIAYGVEICPNKPGGLELICRYRREMLEAFRGLNVGLFSLGAYDQGGCTCPQCRPWGANGYLRTCEVVAPLVKQSFPNAKCMVVTWHFDLHWVGEWEALKRAFANGAPAWADCLLAEYPLKPGVPGGLPVVGFPEISMSHMWPWGAFGANPRINHWQQYWEDADKQLAVAIPYSEGFYEDLNKVLHLQHGWNRHRPLRDIAREYAASEFALGAADTIVNAMLALETAMDHNIDHAAIAEALRAGHWDGAPIYKLPPTGSARSLLRQVENEIPAEKRAGWRWRLLMLRALLDEELNRSGRRPTAQSDAYFEELIQLYHAENADWLVSPVSRRALTRLRSVFVR